jgi:hypothetical protein
MLVFQLQKIPLKPPALLRNSARMMRIFANSLHVAPNVVFNRNPDEVDEKNGEAEIV